MCMQSEIKLRKASKDISKFRYGKQMIQEDKNHSRSSTEMVAFTSLFPHQTSLAAKQEAHRIENERIRQKMLELKQKALQIEK